VRADGVGDGRGPPVVTKPSVIVLSGQNALTVAKLLPSPYSAFVLNGMTVLPLKL
jgi:hypothetical protein